MLPGMSWMALLDVLLVGILIYQVVAIVRGRRAAQVLSGVAVLLVIYGLATVARMELLRTVLSTVATYAPFVFIVMFQTEIRRVLARIGRHWFIGFKAQAERREAIDEIQLAVDRLSQTRTGALIVVEGRTGLRTFIESGVTLDARVSRDLLLAIFQKEAPLHDGAVIIQGDRVAAAACFLPISMNPGVVGKVGTRHRAAIGITEETSDCIVVIVSEETGRISIAQAGVLERDITPQRVADRLSGRAPRPTPVESQPVERGA